MTPKGRRSNGTDGFQLRSDRHDLPLREPEVANHKVLPLRFACPGMEREAQRQGDRILESMISGDVRGGTQDRGGIPSAGESDPAWRFLERREEEPLEGLSRTRPSGFDLGDESRRAAVAEYRAGTDLEGFQPGETSAPPGDRPPPQETGRLDDRMTRFRKARLRRRARS